jgi:hypothetical protein
VAAIDGGRTMDNQQRTTNHQHLSTQPMIALALLDYRYAIDAALATIGDCSAVAVRCNAGELMGEIRQRIRRRATLYDAVAALWVEPLRETWRAELREFADELPTGAMLAVIASQPLARLLPERYGTESRPFGLQLGGIARLRRALGRFGFSITASYGFHSLVAIALNALSAQVARRGRPDIGDRLRVAAQLRYCAPGPLAALSTVALIVARKG